jgi:flagellar biosynthesis protein FlhB
MKSKLLSLQTLIWFCAIGLASFSGYYSVYGISKLFSGGSWSIIGMAAMLEFSKLVVITFLHEHFKTLKLLFKFYLMSSAAVLMILTSVGVYGYLTNSYQETAKSIYETQNKIALLEQKKKIFTEQKTQIDTLVKQKTERIFSYDRLRLSQENSLNSQLTQKQGTRGLQKNIQSVDQSTQTLNEEISQLNQKSIGLSDSVALLEQNKLVLENSTFSSEIGPLLYLSRLTGKPMDVIVNWFILVLVSVFDPLAVSLIIAANHLRHKEKERINVESQITDAVTVSKIETVPTEEITEVVDIDTVIEKKDLENEEKMSIFEVDEEKKVFYGEPSVHSYRRGISV